VGQRAASVPPGASRQGYFVNCGRQQTRTKMNTNRHFFLFGTLSVFLCAGAPTVAPAAEAAAQTNRISGQVTDAAGQPVAGAAVEYWVSQDDLNPFSAGKVEKAVTTGADGAFEFQVASGAGTLLARKTGLAPAWKQWGVRYNQRNEAGYNLGLTAPGTLTGVVVDESNRPAANVEVYVSVALGQAATTGGGRTFSYLAGQAARELFSARTDANGHFAIGNFPTNAGASLEAEVPGKVVRAEDANVANNGTGGYRAGDSDIKLTLEPAGRIEGKVVFAENNQPLPSVRLSLLAARPGQPFWAGQHAVEPGADGSFRIEGVPAGSYGVTARFGTNDSPEWVAEAVTVDVEGGQTVRGVEVKAVRGLPLEVTVRGSDNQKPLANVTVSAFRQNARAAAVTGQDGIAHLRLLPGEYQIMANQNSSVSPQSSATVAAGVTNRAELEMESPRKIAGVVRGPDGRPAAGWHVQTIGGYGGGAGELKTDADGKFELEWNPRQNPGQGEPTMCVLVRDVDKDLTAAADVDEDTSSVDLKLAPGLTLVGKAECDGKPLTNVTATLVFWSGNQGSWMQDFTRANTPGRYEIPALPPGRKYGVIVSAPGYGQKQLFNFEVRAEPGRQELDTVELKLANLKLAGQVVDADEKPVRDCNVNLNGEDQPNANTRTDHEGRFTFDHVCDGPVRLFANGGGGFGNVAATGGDTNVVLQLGQNAAYNTAGANAHKLRGVVTDADGKPVPGAELAVFPQFGARHWSKANADGSYSLTWSLQPWQVQNSGGGRLVARDLARGLAIVVEDLPEEATNLDVKLKPAVTLTGQVKHVDGTPMPGAEINLLFKAGNMYDQFETRTRPTDADGHYEIKGLPADGQYIVSASAHGYGQSQQNVTTEADQTRVDLVAMELKPADRVIAGQVLKEDDKPASGVNVNMNGEGQPNGNMTTDSKGRFHFQVCAGQVRLYAFSQFGGGNGQASAEAGDTNIVINLTAQPGMIRQAARRTSMKSSSLPDLTTVSLGAEAAPAGKPVLMCLFDVSQRPSRHTVHLLDQLIAALGQKGVSVVGVQATPVADDVFNEWKTASPVTFPVGRVLAKSDQTAWTANVGALPWLVLTDGGHKVVAEGFSLDELDTQIQKLGK